MGQTPRREERLLDNALTARAIEDRVQRGSGRLGADLSERVYGLHRGTDFVPERDHGERLNGGGGTVAQLAEPERRSFPYLCRGVGERTLEQR